MHQSACDIYNSCQKAQTNKRELKKLLSLNENPTNQQKQLKAWNFYVCITYSSVGRQS